MRFPARHLPRDLRDIGFEPTQVEGGAVARTWPNGGYEAISVEPGPGGLWRRSVLSLAPMLRVLSPEEVVAAILDGSICVAEGGGRRLLVPSARGGGLDGVGVADSAPGTGIANIAARQLTIASVVYDQQYVISISERVRSAVVMGAFLGTVLAAAHAAGAGFWYLQSPNANTNLAALRRLEVQTQMGSALSTPTAPRLSLERTTQTATAQAGTAIATAQRDTGDTAKTLTWTSTTSGPTITAGTPIYQALPIMTTGTAGWSFTVPSALEYEPAEDGMVIVRALQGLIFRQPDAGTTSDTRKFLTNLVVEEFTLP